MASRAGALLSLALVLPTLLPSGVAPAAALPAQAVDCDLALVLSGGGARGVAHLGVLRTLEDSGIRPDCIAGSSMGAVIGSLYASGYELEQIEMLLRRLDWQSIYAEPQDRMLYPILHRRETQRAALRIGVRTDGLEFPRSLLSDYRVNRVLMEYLTRPGFAAGGEFDRLPIPFRTLGTDLRTGDRVVLRGGDLARAVRASMSVPLAYTPVEWNGHLLVDGGLVDNVPVSLAREMGADYVIAVDVSTPIEPELTADLLGVTLRIVDLLYDARNTAYYREPDLEVRPRLEKHNFADYSRLDWLAERGSEAMRERLPDIPGHYRQPGRRPRARPDPALEGRIIGEVEVHGAEYLSTGFVLDELELEPGEPFQFERALEGLDRIFSSGLVKSAWLGPRPGEGDRVDVRIDVVEEYRRTVDLGLAYQNDDQVQGLLRLETRNELGLDERISLSGFASARDLILQLGIRGEHLVGTHAGYQIDLVSHRDKPKFFRDGEFVNRAAFDRSHLAVSTHLPFGRSQLLEVGFRLGTVEIEPRLGLDFEIGDVDQRIVVGRFVWDDLNSLMLPKSGRMIGLEMEHDLKSLGGDVGYWRASGEGQLAVPLAERWTLETHLLYGYSTGLPVYEEFRVGGPELIPGVDRQELWGAHAAAAGLGLSFDPFPILRLTARAGAGNAWDDFAQIRADDLILGGGLGLTVATPVGPFRLGWGAAEGGRSHIYFSVGFQ